MPVRELPRKKGTPLCMWFVDLTKAYHSVDRTLLYFDRARFGISQRKLVVIRQFHEGHTSMWGAGRWQVLGRVQLGAGLPASMCYCAATVQCLVFDSHVDEVCGIHESEMPPE